MSSFLDSFHTINAHQINLLNQGDQRDDHIIIETPGAIGSNDIHLKNTNVKLHHGAVQVDEIQNKNDVTMISFPNDTSIDFNNRTATNLTVTDLTTGDITSMNYSGQTLDYELDTIQSNINAKVSSTGNVGNKFLTTTGAGTIQFSKSVSDIVDTTSSQILTNKELTTPVIETIVKNSNSIALPSSAGTLALTSDLPLNTSDLNNDSGFVTSTSTTTFENKTISASNNTITDLNNNSITNGQNYIKADSTDTLTNKSIDASNNTISNLNNNTITNGANYITNSSNAFDYNNLANQPTIPSNNNELTNGAGYITATSSDTLQNKTLTTPVISTISNSGTLTLPTSTGTLALTTEIPQNLSDLTQDLGYITATSTDTLQNKTLTSPIISTISNTGTLTLPTSTGTVALTSDIPTNNNQLTNGAGFITDTSNAFDYTNLNNIPTNLVTTDSDQNITSEKTVKDDFTIDEDNAGTLRFNLTNGSARKTKLISQAHQGPTLASTNTIRLPSLNNNTSSDTLVGEATTATLSNKTLTSPIISTISNTGTLTLPTSTGTVALTSDIPANTSDLSNDSGFITNSANAYSYANLSGKPTIPANTSDLTNDSNFITNSANAYSYANLSGKPTIPANTSDLTNDSNFITNSANAYSYANLSGKPTIPANTSDLSNDSGFITNSANAYSYANLSGKPTIPANTSDLSNDSGFITNSQTVTLTNKTMDYNSNTFQNFPTGDVTASSTDTFTNKSISGSSNTLTNIPYSALTGTPTNLLTTDSAQDITDVKTIKSDVIIDQVNSGELQFQQSFGVPASTKTTKLVVVPHSTSTTPVTISLPSVKAGASSDQLVSLEAIQTLTGKTMDYNSNTFQNFPAGDVTASSTDTFTNKTISGSSNTLSNIPYSALTGTPTIPTNTSDLTNDSNFITNTANAFSYSNLSGAPTIPSNNSSLTNGAGYITDTLGSALQNDFTFSSYSSGLFSAPSMILRNQGTTAGGFFGMYNDGGTTPALAIDDDGNIGIGTTDPKSGLQVIHDQGLTISATATTGVRTAVLRLGSPYTTDVNSIENYCAKITSTNNQSANYSSDLRFFTHTNGQSFNGSTDQSTERMCILGNGNVGIGTQSPNCALEVHGGTDNPGDEVLILSNAKDTSATGYHSIFVQGGHHYDVYNNSTIQDGKSTSNGVPFHIQYYSGGDVSLCAGGGRAGVGISSPLSYVRLQVNQTGTGHGIFSTGSATQTHFAFSARNSSSIDTWAIRYNGTQYTSSDDRLKHNAKNITNALSIIKKLNPVRYFKTAKMFDENHNFEIDSNGNPITSEDYHIETGFIAQEVKTIPELDYCVSDGITVEQPYILNYQDIFVHNVEATKQLIHKVESLEARLAALENNVG